MAYCLFSAVVGRKERERHTHRERKKEKRKRKKERQKERKRKKERKRRKKERVIENRTHIFSLGGAACLFNVRTLLLLVTFVRNKRQMLNIGHRKVRYGQIGAFLGFPWTASHGQLEACCYAQKSYSHTQQMSGSRDLEFSGTKSGAGSYFYFFCLANSRPTTGRY